MISWLIAGAVLVMGLAEIYAIVWLFGMIMVVVGTFLDALAAAWRVIGGR